MRPEHAKYKPTLLMSVSEDKPEIEQRHPHIVQDDNQKILAPKLNLIRRD
jgi:hypothetical protein